MTWRPLGIPDVPALRDLHTAARLADGSPDEVMTLPEVRHFFFERPGADAPVDSLGGFAADGSLQAAGVVWCRPSPTVMGRAVLLGDVHPDARRRGLGRALLGWQEARAVERFIAELPHSPLPRRIDAYGPETDAGRTALLRGAGYQVLRWFMKMECPLAGSPPVLEPQPGPEPTRLPDGVRVEPWSAELEEAAREANNDAFRDHFGFEPVPVVGWHHRVTEDPRFLPEHSRLALDGSTVVGYVLCSAPDAQSSVRPTAWLDMIGVRRAWRRRGIATALMASAMDSLRAAGYMTAQLDVDADSPTGAVSLYARRGFRRLRADVLYGKDVPAPG